MKNKLLISVLFLVCFVSKLHAQVYISGNGALPFASIGNSNQLTTTSRITHASALSQINSFSSSTERKKTIADLTGEYYQVNGMIIELNTQKCTPTKDFRPLQKTRLEFRNLATAGSLDDYTTFYFDDVKKIGNLEVFYSYFLNSNRVLLIIQDNAGKYVLGCKIFHAKADTSKARSFINTLVTSITFK